jgi:hypothetical protein
MMTQFTKSVDHLIYLLYHSNDVCPYKLISSLGGAIILCGCNVWPIYTYPESFFDRLQFHVWQSLKFSAMYQSYTRCGFCILHR